MPIQGARREHRGRRPTFFCPARCSHSASRPHMAYGPLARQLRLEPGDTGPGVCAVPASVPARLVVRPRLRAVRTNPHYGDAVRTIPHYDDAVRIIPHFETSTQSGLLRPMLPAWRQERESDGWRHVRRSRYGSRHASRLKRPQSQKSPGRFRSRRPHAKSSAGNRRNIAKRPRIPRRASCQLVIRSPTDRATSARRQVGRPRPQP
jgi:hypothetical protein